MAASRTTQWRWISGILGILCLLLLMLLGILLSKSKVFLEIKPTNSTGITVNSQEGDSTCCSCPEGWIGYKCSCYFISNEEKSWEASRNFCEFKNSSLLQLYSREELHFLRYSKKVYWIGISYNKDRRAWLWLNGTAVSLNLFRDFQAFDTTKCVWYSTSEKFFDHSCEDENYYICKKKLI
ncbi:natural killer cells antigen CD94-like [Sorex fumeus]|uniref:natural killer cells antigen CD94-like n=1 Tax=Sorex fumeus TaxID=62283 RepID=UPI0024ADA12F|nr:natural killer cells antigen CD94-like [Sorex fumeus]